MRLLPPFRNCLVLTGPTASGKSAVALDLAERLGGEILAMDSMTLYRGMDVGTAKPSAADRARVPHHLLDVLDPWESANVAWWMRHAQATVAEVEARGKRAILVGGTPFYLKALVHGLFDAPPTDPELRSRLEAEAATVGPIAFHAGLRAVDAVAAERLHPNDVRRVVRALEVWHGTGRTLTDWQRQEWFADGPPPDDAFNCVALDPPRDELYRRIESRVDAMLSAGWLEEVRRLRDDLRGWSKEASQALGYGELSRVLAGEGTLADATAEIKLRSRQFAKRQLTWFRNLGGVRMLPSVPPGFGSPGENRESDEN